ncbi:hypothetical protein HMPREF9306_00378 [Propionimicrobium lymphophilum ACS-093-V-SCH5]|uniref:Uncharacterized protein n=1 Tax=Propionimicrobium lymphophilum ACS-093-V-SCH5 TaxID=883161 RepID=S2W1H1_9ACTN|nr:hypothetical protein [Propionimicrobium lymphophilum]EPD33623.1 hypothetical protein HMPREF9306_00378 [Propionimicrobium lymphophilum ACS-093-V-SCH5]
MFGFVLDHKTTSRQLGLRFTAPLEIPAATRQVDDIEVAGRAGSLTRFAGWADTEISLPLAVQGGPETYRQACFALMDASAISFSGEPGLFRYLKHVEVSPLAREMGSWGMFQANLTCQPFTYLATGLKPITLTSTATIINPGLLPSDPEITLFGTGQLVLTINGQRYKVSSPVDQITLDSARMITHVCGKTQTDALSGFFPQLAVGENHIELGAGLAKVAVNGNWRTL